MNQQADKSFLHPEACQQAFADLFGAGYADRFSDPVSFVNTTFYSPPVSQEYRQNFKVLSRNLFAEWVYRRRKDFNEEILNNYVQISGKKLDAIAKLITVERDRLRTVAESNGIEIDAGYLHCKVHVIPIIHNHALEFVKILQLFDELLQITGSCALKGILNAQERKRIEVKARGAIRSFSGTIRSESIKMRQEAQRLQREGLQDDSELINTIASQQDAEHTADAQAECDRLGLTVPANGTPQDVLVTHFGLTVPANSTPQEVLLAFQEVSRKAVEAIPA